MSFFTGRKEKFQQVPSLSGEQSNFLSSILSNLGQGGLAGQGYQSAIQNLLGILQGSPQSYAAIEEPARRGFQQQTIPSILERFSGAGARSSSGLQQTLGQAGANLETNLAAQRGERQQNAVQQLLGNFLSQGQLGLGTRAFENIMRPAQPGFLQNFGQNLSEGLQGGGQIGTMLTLLKILGAL